LIKLTDEMRELVSNSRFSGNPCVIATSATDGTPDCAYIGTMLATYDTTFIYRDRSGRLPSDNIEENLRVVMLFRHAQQQTGWKFRCTSYVHRQGPVYEDGIKRLTDAGLITDPEIKSAIVVLDVHQVLTLFGEVLQEREPPIGW
jgi:predicted pyridoxine 5'-phosphate oxidase superfamily flavin-nucleotide-binding protein